ncbi:sensor histidine kinase [Actinomyces minihominis]|uniref:sensor histidine kinase n=1 Tax=Actinomyces minihominis TaxID=2002838 RepID=UPI000C074761|nr:ATP-binding protein [Actinomyces minihominis]
MGALPRQNPDGLGIGELPLAAVVGKGKHHDRIAQLLQDGLTDLVEVRRFATPDEARFALGCPAGEQGDDAPSLVALYVLIVGEGTRPADEMVAPLLSCPACRDTRFIVLSTKVEITGAERMIDLGRLDWVGYLGDLRPDAFISSMKAQVQLFHEHGRVGTVPHVSSLFQQPYSDSVIIGRVLSEIEETLGTQPRLTIPVGTRLTTKGDWVEEVTIILEGSVALIHESPGGDIVMHEESTGRIIGLLAVSEGRRALLNAVTTSEVRGVRLTVEQLNSAIEGHPDITILVATLFIRSLDRRLRRAEELHIENAELSDQLETERTLLATALSNLEDARTELSAQERLASLGALSAGIAHELNNPMAAIQRISEFLGEDVTKLLETAPAKKWSDQALTALKSGQEVPSLSTRAERQLRRELTEITGDPAVAQRLTLAGIRDPEFARALKRRSGLSLEAAEQAASIGTQLRNLRSAATRITQLVSSLRSYARPDGDKVGGVDLQENIDDAIRLLSHKLDEVEVVRFYEDLPTLECHPGELAQVWTNLLTNAAEAVTEASGNGSSPAGRKLGTIEVTTGSPTPGWLRVEIKDDGPGIPESILPHVFEPRFTTKSGQVRFGMGVGLGVTRSIVSKHHGTMRLNTGPNGTTVVVDLPIAPPQEEQ